MPNRLQGNNASTWNDLTTPNYPLLYIARWIPLNAWYCQLANSSTDRDCLIYLKINSNNRIYDIIWDLLQERKSDFDNLFFQNELVKLDECLETYSFPNNESRLRFGIAEMLPNPISEKSARFKGWEYKVKRYTVAAQKTKGTVESTILDLRNPSNITSFDIPQYNMEDFVCKIKSERLTAEKKQQLMDLFVAIEPIIHIDIKNVKGTALKFGNKKYLNDRNPMCIAIVDLLYELRCKAVHGEFEVTQKATCIYEHAYNMLNLITNKLF